MNNVRLWIVLLGLTCFAAGLSTGLMMSPDSGAALRSGEPFEEYRTAVARRFELDAERERLFAELLRNYSQAIEETRTRLLQRSRPELERELAEIGERYQALIRDYVVPPERRGEFDALSETWQAIQ